MFTNVIGAIRDHEFTYAMHNIMYNTRTCSGAICSSQLAGAAYNWASEVEICLTVSRVGVVST